MLTLHLADFSLEHFMEHYWQQKPVVIRQGFQNFEDLISPNDLAGLACEDEVESRLVFKKDGQWQAEVGPFESYKCFGKGGWTLVVQAVNHWSPEVAELVNPFAFIPKWRLDDVMISYVTPSCASATSRSSPASPKASHKNPHPAPQKPQLAQGRVEDRLHPAAVFRERPVCHHRPHRRGQIHPARRGLPGAVPRDPAPQKHLRLVQRPHDAPHGGLPGRG